MLRSAPCSMNNEMESSSTFVKMGVSPSLFRAFTSAPSFNNSSSTSVRKISWSGVFSSLSRAFTFAPASASSRVEIVQRSSATAGPGGGTLEDLFHLMVVISIQTTELLRFLGALQLSTHKTELRTVVGLNAQATVGPELPLAAEPVRGLHQRDQAGGSNRTDAGNLAQQFRRFVFPALGQELGSDVSPQDLQSVQLLIEQLRAAAHPGLRNLAQPFLSTARSINLGAGTGNAPTAIQCLQSIHHARQIFADGLITAPQLA